MKPDAVLRRVERTAVVFCAAMAIAALAIAPGSPWPSAAVLAGGILIGTSYWSIKSGVSGLIDATAARGEGRAPRGRIALQLAGRYALLGFMAYVMIARLRLPPLWLLAGASSIVAAVTVEAVRVLTKKS
jgi:4-hydroxybenzoate polyprenyltransferase